MTPDGLASKAGITLFDHQREYLDAMALRTGDRAIRSCLYYKTGAGKSFTSLAAIALLGWSKCLVISPPSTHDAWVTLGQVLDVEVQVMSHAKFRQKDVLVSRTTPVIADEMHLFGGQQGQGWKKLDRLSRHLKAPLILASATPNYNDAERCYCIEHVLDPSNCQGGFLAWLYRHCETEQDPFSMTPKVLGFRSYNSAAEYLADLPGVYYLPDDLVLDIEDVEYPRRLPDLFTRYGYNSRATRMVASIIEEKHTEILFGLVDDLGFLQPRIYQLIADEAKKGPLLVFANHASVARAAAHTLEQIRAYSYGVVTGGTPKKEKLKQIHDFRTGRIQILIGTASLATGTDGLDKVCHTLLIIDDTEDDSLRRQLIGRITPRGDYVSPQPKRVIRLVPNDL